MIDRAVVVGGSDEGAMAFYYDSRLPKPFSSSWSGDGLKQDAWPIRVYGT